MLKTEPNDYSWQDMVREVVCEWDGVKGHQAQAFLRQMQVNDLAFFYHSGTKRAIVGVVQVVRSFYLPNAETAYVSIDVRCLEPLPRAVSLKEMKAEADLDGWVILKQPRLSVAPVSRSQWLTVMRMAER